MFISNAYADTAGGFDAIMQRPDFLIIGLMVVAMYFVMIRPQMKRQKELKAMMDALAKGDEVRGRNEPCLQGLVGQRDPYARHDRLG